MNIDNDVPLLYQENLSGLIEVKKNNEFTNSHLAIMLRDFFHIGIAAILGALLRLTISNLFKIKKVTSYYTTTFVSLPANFLGCIIMGIFSPAKIRISTYSPSLALFIGTGFCGSLTTWSSWNLEMS